MVRGEGDVRLLLEVRILSWKVRYYVLYSRGTCHPLWKVTLSLGSVFHTHTILSFWSFLLHPDFFPFAPSFSLHISFFTEFRYGATYIWTLFYQKGPSNDLQPLIPLSSKWGILMGKKTEKRREQKTQRKKDTKKDARRRTEWSWMVPSLWFLMISFVTWLLLLLKHSLQSFIKLFFDGGLLCEFIWNFWNWE